MKRVALIGLLSIAVTASMAVAVAGDKDKDKTAFKPGPASSYPNAQTLDKITIAVVPYVTAEEAASAFGKADPYRYGILPVLVVIDNNTGKTLRLDLQAEYEEPGNQHLESVPPSDVVLYGGAKKASWKVPTPNPLPIPRSSIKKGPLNTWEIEGRAFAAKLVPPGESVSGFFYFSVEHKPGSRLYLTGIKDAATGKDYFYFEVPFEKQ
jgi:hypothetical protein